MKTTILVISIVLNLLFLVLLVNINFGEEARASSYCRKELKETLYLLDYANTLLKKGSPKLRKKNPYLYKLVSLEKNKSYSFELNPKIDVISHSSSYGFMLEVNRAGRITHIGWYKP